MVSPKSILLTCRETPLRAASTPEMRGWTRHEAAVNRQNRSSGPHPAQRSRRCPASCAALAPPCLGLSLMAILLFCPGAGPRVSQATGSLHLLLLLLLRAQEAASARCERDVSARHVACGQRHVQGKILEGEDAPEKKWPWQVSVHYGGFHICGGSIISEYWILSAAHCFGRTRNTEAFDMYVGLVDLQVAASHTQWFEVNKVILHDTYALHHPIGGDVALVQLKTRIVFSDSVLPVCIATPDVNLQNHTCWATGWGLISPKGDTSNYLQEIQVPLIPFTLCQLLYGQTSYIQPDMMCAGDLRNMKTVCEGDSGGPLVCEFNRIWVQIGIVSWGRGCMFPMYPAVYARVSYFSEWIHHQITSICPPPQLLPTLSSTLGASITVLVTMVAFLPIL
ncbi:serine protease 38 [Saccopteryx bilineata]|uniref:serine protease 38 n=1 Tax=Saccopteryx bilineata TaxID=59482 RepID=UPI00338DF346